MTTTETARVAIASDFTLDPSQQRAIERCIDFGPKNRIVGVTGSAGTGKTTLMRLIAEIAIAAGYSTALSAPTGRAARRITEATGFPAVTNHKLLEFPRPRDIDENTGKALDVTMPKRNLLNPLDQDLLLVDEASMVTKLMYRQLLQAMKAGAHIRFFGDANQLPPIEDDIAIKTNYDPKLTPFEAVLKNLDGVWLDTIHRQEEGSGIAQNGKQVLCGKLPRKLDDFTIRITKEDHVNLIIEYVKNSGIDFKSTRNQIIVPGRKGAIGTVRLNGIIQHLYQPEQAPDFLNLPRYDRHADPIRVRVGDKVIWTKNNYDLEIMNGDIGIVEATNEFGEVIIAFDDGVKTIPPELPFMVGGKERFYDPRRDIELAYAITTHRAQGSEYENVVYGLHPAFIFNLANRANLYTGITRARKHVHLIADSRTLNKAVATPGR